MHLCFRPLHYLHSPRETAIATQVLRSANLFYFIFLAYKTFSLQFSLPRCLVFSVVGLDFLKTFSTPRAPLFSSIRWGSARGGGAVLGSLESWGEEPHCGYWRGARQ